MVQGITDAFNINTNRAEGRLVAYERLLNLNMVKIHKTLVFLVFYIFINKFLPYPEYIVQVLINHYNSESCQRSSLCEPLSSV